MGIGFITDNEIDRILGKMDKRSASRVEEPVDDHIRKPVDLSINRDLMAPGFIKMNAFSKTNTFAGPIRRTYALFADLCISGLVLVGFVYASIIAFGQEDIAYTAGSFAEKAREFGGMDVGMWMATLYLLILFFYFIFFDGIAGRTPGKMFLNIKVVDSKGDKPSFIKVVFRTIVFLIPPLGLLKIHDLATGSKVINND